jgi:hypothetical protein
MTSPEDRRMHGRVESLYLLSFVSHDENGQVFNEGMGRTLNVSEGGILLEASDLIEPQYPLLMTIGLKDELIEIRGRIVHTSLQRDGTYLYGVQFDGVDQEKLKILRRYIAVFTEQRMVPEEPNGDLNEGKELESHSVKARGPRAPKNPSKQKG